MTEAVEGLVSVVIPVHNRAALVRAAVASVLAQTYPRYEIILVDDGSTDGTPVTLRALAAAHPDRIRVVSQPNAGPGVAREAGRRLARGEFIQYLDSDDLLLPRKLELQIALLRAHPEVDIAYGVTRLVDDAGAVLRAPYRWTGEDRPGLFPGLLVDRWWSTHTPLWRRSFSDRVGPWSSLRYSEDWEYEARAGGLGARLKRVEAEVCDVRAHAQVRETKAGRWLDPSDQILLFKAILDGALAAGVDLRCSEARHFARWVFSRARRLAGEGHVAAARSLMRVARDAQDRVVPDFVAFSALASVLGYSRAGKLVEGLRERLGRRPGARTLRQSWMDPEPSP